MSVVAQSSDAELLHAMSDGLDALDVLYERYRALAFSIAIRITQDASLAEDAVQEAFLGVWRNASTYDVKRGSVRVWLLTVVHHRAVDALRRRKPTSPLPDQDLPLPTRLHAPDVWDEVAAGLDAAAVRRAMATLSNVQRVAIEMAYFGGLTQAEIAEQTDAPLGTVKSRIRTGLLAMRMHLYSHMPEGSAVPAP